MNVLIVNTHSALNSGDLAITIAEIRLLKQCCPVQHITVTSRTPAIDARVLAPMGVRVLPPLLPAPSVFNGAMQKLSGSIRNMAGVGSKRAVWKAARASDFVISSGGGYFWSNRTALPGPMFLQNYAHVKLASVLRKPIIFFPQSFGPLYNPWVGYMLRAALSGPNVVRIFPRERLSLEFLRHLLRDGTAPDRIALCPDAAFCLRPRTDETDRGPTAELPRPVVAVTVRSWDFPNTRSGRERAKKQRSYLEGLAMACRKLHEQWNASLLVFPQSRGPGPFENDTPPSNALCRMLMTHVPTGRVRVVPLSVTVRPERIIDMLSSVDLLIATRFHSAIFAFLAGTPAVSVSYQPKGKGIMQELGLGRFAVDISDVDPDRIAGLANEILEHRQYYSHLVRGAVSGLRKTALERLSDTLAGFGCDGHHEGTTRQ